MGAVYARASRSHRVRGRIGLLSRSRRGWHDGPAGALPGSRAQYVATHHGFCIADGWADALNAVHHAVQPARRIKTIVPIVAYTAYASPIIWPAPRRLDGLAGLGFVDIEVT